jgi:hypothetical protein
MTVFDERDGGTFFGFADPDGNTWAVQEIRARAEKPLIPPEARQPRFGESETLKLARSRPPEPPRSRPCSY